MDAGELLDLEITDVAHGGVFVSRHEGRVVFVSDAIPGERVRAHLAQGGDKSFWRAETLEVLDASPHRRPHVWADADVSRPPEQRPGGAEFGHIDLAHQRELKLRVMADALARMGGVNASPTIEPALAGPEADAESSDGTGWRTRVSLHVDDERRIGPFAARSHRVIPVPELPLATREIEDAMRGLPTAQPGRVDLVQPADGRVRVIGRPARAPRPDRRSRARHPARHREVVVERVGGREFLLDAAGFWQVHRLAAHTLSAAVRDALGGLGGIDPDARHLDLYGGVGLLAAAIADVGGPATRITTVESDARATAHAGVNLAEWVGARAESDRVDRYLARTAATATVAERDRIARGVVVLDPPRSGAGRAVVDSIAGLGPAHVVYVACDPVALARDLGTFRTAGYTTASVRAIDLYPNSHHVEAVAVLTR